MNTLRSLAAACLLAALPGPLPAQTQGADLPSVADLFAPDAWGKSPDQLAWAPDGESLGFLWDDGHGDALWTLAPGGTPERRLALADLAAAGEKAPSLDAYSWLPDGSGWLVTAGGDLYLAPLGSAARRLTKTPAEESEAAVSPKGDRASFVRGHDLFAIDLKTGRETRLTRGGRENETLNGETDWVYWEEIWNRDATGSWWAPDGRRIAYYHFDERPVSVYPLIDDVPKNA
ncbi:MAG TPA: DPP IV N-terminal domain-containing protein, partial [Thermoanaerobaculia bacterium]|nr:DPP IV N-terminal domain-containing protein [Thermoanaerobaculia bacterium]